MSDVAALLAAYDEQMRRAEVANLRAGAHAERDGPILQRLGFVAVTTTTPYVWAP